MLNTIMIALANTVYTGILLIIVLSVIKKITKKKKIVRVFTLHDGDKK